MEQLDFYDMTPRQVREWVHSLRPLDGEKENVFGFSLSGWRFSPSDIEVIIHYYGCMAPHPRADAPAVMDATARFLDLELIKPVGDGVYETTRRGKAWVQMICNTPLPELAWIDDQGRVIAKTGEDHAPA